jgi:exosortase/archaeosortase family protein
MPRIYFSIFGVAVIYLVNITRIVILSYTQYYWPQVFDFTHDYSTTAIFYIVIFVLWMIWANYGEPMDLEQSYKSPESAVS